MKKKKIIRISEQNLVDMLQDVLTGGLSSFLNKDLSSDKTKKSTISNQKNSSVNFEDTVDKVIDNLEGGYYHPDMLKDGRVKDSRYGNSGETMFGIDRKAGNQEATPAGKEFWSIIDNENARQNWSWNYQLKDNPQLSKKLKRLAAEIMEPLFVDYSNKYLTPESKEIVLNDPNLFFNFVYSTWNGPGWFKKMADNINKSVENGVTDPNQLLDVDINFRKNQSNSLIAQGGKKLDQIKDIVA